MIETIRSLMVNIFGSPVGSVVLFIGVYLLLQMVILPRLGIST